MIINIDTPTTQDVGYYAHYGSNLFNLVSLCENQVLGLEVLLPMNLPLGYTPGGLPDTKFDNPL